MQDVARLILEHFWRRQTVFSLIKDQLIVISEGQNVIVNRQPNLSKQYNDILLIILIHFLYQQLQVLCFKIADPNIFLYYVLFFAVYELSINCLLNWNIIHVPYKIITGIIALFWIPQKAYFSVSLTVQK